MHIRTYVCREISNLVKSPCHHAGYNFPHTHVATYLHKSITKHIHTYIHIWQSNIYTNTQYNINDPLTK